LLGLVRGFRLNSLRRERIGKLFYWCSAAAPDSAIFGQFDFVVRSYH